MAFSVIFFLELVNFSYYLFIPIVGFKVIGSHSMISWIETLIANRIIAFDHFPPVYLSILGVANVSNLTGDLGGQMFLYPFTLVSL